MQSKTKIAIMVLYTTRCILVMIQLAPHNTRYFVAQILWSRPILHSPFHIQT